jgi:hypothetical protein
MPAHGVFAMLKKKYRWRFGSILRFFQTLVRNATKRGRGAGSAPEKKKYYIAQIGRRKRFSIYQVASAFFSQCPGALCDGFFLLKK